MPEPKVYVIFCVPAVGLKVEPVTPVPVHVPPVVPVISELRLIVPAVEQMAVLVHAGDPSPDAVTEIDWVRLTGLAQIGVYVYVIL